MLITILQEILVDSACALRSGSYSVKTYAKNPDHSVIFYRNPIKWNANTIRTISCKWLLRMPKILNWKRVRKRTLFYHDDFSVPNSPPTPNLINRRLLNLNHLHPGIYLSRNNDQVFYFSPYITTYLKIISLLSELPWREQKIKTTKLGTATREKRKRGRNAQIFSHGVCSTPLTTNKNPL